MLFTQKIAKKACVFRIRLFVLSAVLYIFMMPFVASAASSPEQATPRIANWNFKYSIESDAEVKQLAKWDVIIADIHQEKNSRERLKKIKELNPDIKFLAYISLADVRPDAANLPQGSPRQVIGKALQDNPQWVTRLSNGQPAEWWPTFYIMNVTDQAPKNSDGQRFNDFFAEYINQEVVQDPIWDGVFYDNLWSGVSFVSPHIDLNQDGIAEPADTANQQWREGVRSILKATRKNAKAHRKHFIVTGNGGTEYHRDVNGVAFEHFPSTVYGKWVDSMQQYSFILRNAVPRQYAIINTNVGNTGNKTDYKKFRFGLGSTLLNDGYYSFDNGDQSHTEKWYFDEYDAVLGQPISGAYNLLDKQHPTQLKRGLWRRDYASATVLVNSTNTPRRIDLRTGLEKINGTQDPVVNSGQVVGAITIPPKDAIVLLHRLTHISDASFTNGAYTKIFDARGKSVRKSFFAHDGSFSGGTQIYRFTAGNKTITSSAGRVSVYNKRNEQVASFYPYGEHYRGKVSIAVRTIKKRKKIKYTIITGAEEAGSGAHVKIYSMNGRVIQQGCFPYGKNVNTGVSVAAGDVNGDGKDEIITSSASRAAHIQIFNKKCRILAPGFYAFPTQWRVGASVAAGDTNGDGRDEIIVGAGRGASPEIRIFNRRGKLITAPFLAYPRQEKSGITVSATDMNADGRDEIITSSFAIFNSF